MLWFKWILLFAYILSHHSSGFFLYTDCTFWAHSQIHTEILTDFSKYNPHRNKVFHTTYIYCICNVCNHNMSKLIRENWAKLLKVRYGYFSRDCRVMWRWSGVHITMLRSCRCAKSISNSTFFWISIRIPFARLPHETLSIAFYLMYLL